MKYYVVLSFSNQLYTEQKRKAASFNIRKVTALYKDDTEFFRIFNKQWS